MIPVAQTAERPLRADARRNRKLVIDAAHDLFAKHGLEAQMDDIAGAAGVGVGTVYRHFPTKEDLLVALIDERFDRFAEHAREVIAADDAWEAFVGFIRFAAELQADDRALSEVMASRPDLMRAAAERAGMFELNEQMVARAQATGKLRKDLRGEDIPMIACSLGRTHIIGETLPYFRLDRLLAMTIDGLRAPGETPLSD
jgi:AcrR family transcriptional regulator